MQLSLGDSIGQMFGSGLKGSAGGLNLKNLISLIVEFETNLNLEVVNKTTGVSVFKPSNSHSQIHRFTFGVPSTKDINFTSIMASFAARGKNID